jgi:hypothetical protein
VLKWLVLPISDDDKSKFLTTDDICKIGETSIMKIISYKHRGAFNQQADALSALLYRCFLSPNKTLNMLPKKLLEKTLEFCKTEGHALI